jgi:methylated-DNA-[protein]-cysteine S-methyltransferase
MANSLNPVAIVIPCHRVIGASLQLTGYAGGMVRKQWLLVHEGVSLEPAATCKDRRQISKRLDRHNLTTTTEIK